MKHFVKNTFLLSLLFIGLTLAACSRLNPNNISDLDSKDIKETPAAEIHLDNGNHLKFFAEGDSPIGLLDVSDNGNDSAADVLSRELDVAIDELTLFDFFWAFSEPGTTVPNFLEFASTDRDQGWARALISASSEGIHVAHANIACDNSNFLEALISNLRSTNPFYRLDRIGSSYTLYDWFGPRYRYTATWTSASSWYARVCIRSIQNNSNNHVVDGVYRGPRIRFQWRPTTGGAWSNSATVYAPANSTRTYVWLGGASATQRRIYIDRLKGQDQFDVAMDREQ